MNPGRNWSQLPLKAPEEGEEESEAVTLSLAAARDLLMLQKRQFDENRVAFFFT